MTRAEQAVQGLDVTVAGGIVMVVDGVDRWLCWEIAYDRRYAALDALDAYADDDGGAEAYTELCGVAGPIASVVGSNRGDHVQLVRQAVVAGLIDADLAMSAYGVAS